MSYLNRKRCVCGLHLTLWLFKTISSRVVLAGMLSLRMSGNAPYFNEATFEEIADIDYRLPGSSAKLV